MMIFREMPPSPSGEEPTMAEPPPLPALRFKIDIPLESISR